MKLVRFEAEDGRVRVGEWLGGGQARVLEGGLFDAAARLGSHGEVVGMRRWLAPLEPPNIFAIGLNYRRHAAETGAELPSAPLVFLKATTAVLAPQAAIMLPRQAPDEVDFEAELAIVIGRTARCVAPTAALEHVLGYCCANDVSARDCQKRIDRQWARGKSFDTFCPLGPWIVTADELPRPDRCAIRCRVNDRVMQDSTTADMIFPCAELISYLSHQFTLLPGTVILTGTPEGVGTARKPPVYLRAGDRVSVEIEGIGVLENPVVRDQD